MPRSRRPRLSESKVAMLAESHSAGLSIRQAARKHGIPISTVAARYSTWNGGKVKGVEGRKFVGRTDGADVEYVSRHEIRTREDAIRFGEVDESRYYVHRWEVTSYETPVKINTGVDRKGRKRADRLKVVHLWRVKLDLRLIAPIPVIDAVKILTSELRNIAPKDWKPAIITRIGDPVLLEVDLFDVHFGKLAWGPETGGDNYDLKIAEARFRHAVEDILAATDRWNIEEILFAIGNDLLHIDNFQAQTTKGTHVDTDSRFPKVWGVMKRCTVWAFEQFLARARVKGMLVQGNHDFLTAMLAAEYLDAWFRNCDRVTIDTGPDPWKIHDYGANLFGYTHGDNVPGDGIKVLPDMLTSMALSAGIDLRLIKRREVKLGHRHSDKQLSTRDVEEIRGTKVRWMNALSATDAWHRKMGFIGCHQAASGIVYAKDGRFVNVFEVDARN